MMNCVLAAGLFFSAHAAPSPSPADLRPAAEVSASSGAVRIILRLHRTKLRLGESLWHQLGIQNSGDERLLITDPIFFEPETMESLYLSLRGIRVEIIRPDGKPLSQTMARFRYPETNDPGVSGSLEVDTPALRSQVARWRQQGLSQHEINLRLIAHHDKKKSEDEMNDPGEGRWLKTGESIWTGSWFYYNEMEKRRNAPQIGPIGDFAELDFFDLREVGVYKVRAVYDWSTTAVHREKLKRLGLPTNGCLRVRTPWIHVRVTR